MGVPHRRVCSLGLLHRDVLRGPPRGLQGCPRTHTRPADAVEIVSSLALATEASGGVCTQVPRPTGLSGRRTLVHIL